VLIGVIVLGLAFGAGLSLLMQRNAGSPVALLPSTAPATPAPPPRAQPTTEKPDGAEKAVAPKPTSTRGISPPPRVSPTQPAYVSSPRPRISVRANRVAVVPSPLVITPAPATRPPYAVPEAVVPLPPGPVPVLRRAATAPPVDEADSEFARLSAGVVRFYLNALARGDDASARTVLDGPRGSASLDLGEKEFTDQSLRIVKLDAHGVSDSATVNVDLSTYKGAYFEQFSLRRLPSGAAVIIEHTFIRP